MQVVSGGDALEDFGLHNGTLTPTPVPRELFGV